MSNNYTTTTETFFGYIETTRDSLLLFEACKRGIIPRISRRLQDKERHLIRSGSIFCFDENESGIKRWTDGFMWSPSRIMGNFLIYRELEDKKLLRSYSCDRGAMDRNYSFNNINSTIRNRSKTFGATANDYYPATDQMKRQREKSLIGSLKSSYKFKKNGLIKKSMSLIVDGVQQHIISYYNKDDVLLNKLITPSSITELSNLEVSPGLRLRQNFRMPTYTTEDNSSDDGYLDIQTQTQTSAFSGGRLHQEAYSNLDNYLLQAYIPKEDALFKDMDSRYTVLSDFSDSSGGYSSADISQNAVDEASGSVLSMQEHSPLITSPASTVNMMDDNKEEIHVIPHLTSIPIHRDEITYHNNIHLKQSETLYSNQQPLKGTPYYTPYRGFGKDGIEKEVLPSNTSFQSSDKPSNMKKELAVLGTPNNSGTQLVMGSVSSGWQSNYHQELNPHQNLFLSSSFHNMTQPYGMSYRNSSIINAYTLDLNMLLNTHEDEFEFQL
ncbi:Gti1/Pac2 family-domain-containing protein [Pilobolus umbonatus]|nr:Gti1/Pac2 family-domain-containing protein [Pilobolus umbonatus]